MRLNRYVIVLLSALVSTGASSSNDCANDASAQAIQDQRSAFNAAIAEEDAETIASVLAEDVLLITGTDSDLYSGREVQVELWRSDFESSERLGYERTPECIQVSERFPIALERGRWLGQPENDSPGVVQGSYSAKWRHDGAAWRLEVEVYMTEECSPSICPEDATAQ